VREGTVKANGVDFAFLEAGTGPLALCLHGFPDSAHTWRYLLPDLACAGFRVVAPFMRGYAPTSVAPDGSYELGALVTDATALHEALDGDDRAVLIGHDWGAETAYGAAALAPHRWRRLVTLAIPPLALDERLFSDYDQLERFFYVFFFKTPHADAVVATGDMAFIDRLWRDWSPNYDATEDLRKVKRCLSEPANLSAALGYYRAEEPGLYGVRTDNPYATEHEALLRTPPQPTLYLHGDRDGCVDISLAADAVDHLAPGSRMDRVEGAGHLSHLESPATVNGRILNRVVAY
jgi:pimeloyl-ACP methyl ester carboxylesterase